MGVFVSDAKGNRHFSDNYVFGKEDPLRGKSLEIIPSKRVFLEKNALLEANLWKELPLRG